MKKILLINSSPRKNGNSESVVRLLADDLADGNEVIIFNTREKDCHPCRACGVCQRKRDGACVQKDDLSLLLPVLDRCDAIVLASPVYYRQVNAEAKMVMDRWYPFFAASMSKTGKKGALILSYWGAPDRLMVPYAELTAENFQFIGCGESKIELFKQIPDKGQILQREDYVERLHSLARWLGA